ncbi:MAG: protoheme IX farnesyltransferase [Acidobacteria bacterium]|nr:MAG: protoheme IX farnesyltransferase [Acidobacteriota bacterium]
MNDLLVLTKVRLNTLVVFTTAAGFYMGARGPIDWLQMTMVCFGTALVAGGSAAFNQIQERDVDALMDRTKNRPMPQARVTVARARTVAYGTSIAGLALLLYFSNALAAGIALATSVLYVVIYTPLKLKSSLATVVGAVPGALPPMIGWAASRGSVELVSWTLFVIMFLWQLPHFLAIAWMYRDDYAKASMPILTVLDKDGAMTGRQAVVYAAALVPFSVAPMLFGMAGRGYGIGALVLGVMLVAVATGFAFQRTRSNARMLFLASITYLPLLLILMAVSRR